MNVLKDASSSAIYGARGANGVVIITTKQAKKGQDAKITVNARWGNNSRGVPNYDVIDDPATYYENYGRALYNQMYYGANATYTNNDAKSLEYANNNIFKKLGSQVYTVPAGEGLLVSGLTINPNATPGYSDGTFYYTNDDWYNEMYNKNNLRQEYEITISGSTEKTNYYMSAGYLDDKGIINSSRYKRYTGRLNADYQAKSWLKVGTNFAYSFEKTSAPPSQLKWGSSGNSFYVADNIAPIYPLYVRNADGSYMYDDMGIQVMDTGTNTNIKRKFSAGNPAIDLLLNSYSEEINYINAKGFAIIDLPIDGLRFTTNINLATSDNRENQLFNPYYGGAASSNGSLNVNHYRRISTNQQYLLTYQKDFGLHNVDLLAGYETYHMKYQKLETSMQNLYLGNVAELDNAATFSSQPHSNTVNYTTCGWLFRAQYNYMQKYYASASFRRDASSRFADGHRWGSFGSIGAAWIISKEAFMSDTSSWLDELKLKASWGIQGNDNLQYAGESNYYPYQDSYEVQNVNGTASPVFAGYKGNKDITWETIYSFNGGVEFSLFKGRLSGSLEYWNRTTKDMLYYKPVALSKGYESYPINSGSMRNDGIELNLDAAVYQTKDVKVNITANLTTMKNKITDYAEKEELSLSIREKGGSIYESYLPSYAGVWHGNTNEYQLADGVTPKLGDALYYMDPDNGNMTVTNIFSAAKRAHQGSTLPKAFGGFGINASAYGFDLSMQFSYQLGGRVYDHKYQGLMSSNGNTGHNWSTDILGAWTASNAESNIPRLDAGVDDSQNSSNRFLISSNYLNLTNVTVGYTLPKTLVNACGLSNVRIYVAGDNLLLLTKRSGLDPRRNFNMGVATLGNGVSDTYAAMKTISGGITVDF